MKKNIYVLPTDKPSRLSILNSGKLNFGAEFINSSNSKAQNIYITSDLEIKEGDWCINKLNEVIQFGKNYDAKSYKKIILTTDPDLIADGVQSIDDEFLEWFVKNPSRERVLYRRLSSGYKIIHPQEPKQDIIASEEDAKIFVDAIKNPPAPNETLEDAAEKYSSISFNRQDLYDGFIEGAKWQAEKMYSEEEVKHIISEALQSALVTADLHQWFKQFKKK